jgi:hypothetical protein
MRHFLEVRYFLALLIPSACGWLIGFGIMGLVRGGAALWYGVPLVLIGLSCGVWRCLKTRAYQLARGCLDCNGLGYRDGHGIKVYCPGCDGYPKPVALDLARVAALSERALDVLESALDYCRDGRSIWEGKLYQRLDGHGPEACTVLRVLIDELVAAGALVPHYARASGPLPEPNLHFEPAYSGSDLAGPDSWDALVYAREQRRQALLPGRRSRLSPLGAA